MSTIKPLCIANGPSKDRLFDSMKYQYEDSSIESNFRFSLDQDDKNAIKVRNLKIVGIQHEDGSGYSFNLEGVCDADLENSSITVYSPYRFKAYYSARTRKGHIEFSRWHW